MRLIESLVVTDNETDPQTAAMLAGAEIEQGVDEARDEHHTVRTHPPDLPPDPEHDSAVVAFDAGQDDADAMPRGQHGPTPRPRRRPSLTL